MNLNMTLFGQMVAFALFVMFCMKYVWPPILAAMTERAEKIAEGLAAAERGHQELELAKKKAVERLSEAKQESRELVDGAHKRAAQIVEEAKEQARVEGDRLKEAAQAEIDQELNRAREQLRAQVAALALAGAEKVLAAEIDMQRHSELLEQFAAEL